MSEERIKLKKKIKINKQSLTDKKVNISTQSEQNEIQTAQSSININIKTNNKNIIFKYGKYKIFIYDSKGDPLFLIGPDYSYFISMLVMNLIYFIFFNYLLITLTNIYIAIIGILLNLIQLIFFIISCMKNPGLPKKEIQKEKLLINEPDNYQRCNSCLFIIEKNKNYFHCGICGCCCEGYDHHCPWTSKCVGKGNIFYFNAMIVMISIVFFYIIFAFVFAKPKK